MSSNSLSFPRELKLVDAEAAARGDGQLLRGFELSGSDDVISLGAVACSFSKEVRNNHQG